MTRAGICPLPSAQENVFYQGQKHTIYNFIIGIIRGGHVAPFFKSSETWEHEIDLFDEHQCIFYSKVDNRYIIIEFQLRRIFFHTAECFLAFPLHATHFLI